MARRLFIPGTGGCFYASEDGVRDASILDLALNKQAEFRCTHSDDPNELEPLRTTAITRSGKPVEIHAAGPIRAVYTAFFDQRKSLTDSAKVYSFHNYDWRLDIRKSGADLWDRLKKSGRGDPWDIVCHSQGGLLVLWASLQSPAEFRDYVRRVVFLGVPIQGTLNSARALAEGVSLIPGVAADPATVRTWPAPYMMLPRWRIGVPNSSGVELFKESVWDRAGLLSTSGNPKDGILPALLERAVLWKQRLDNEPFDAMQALERFVVIEGSSENTWLTAPDFPSFPDISGPRDGSVLVRGDGLVPADRTVELLPPALKDKIELLSPEEVTSHMLMCASEDLTKVCDSLLTAH